MAAQSANAFPRAVPKMKGWPVELSASAVVRKMLPGWRGLVQRKSLELQQAVLHDNTEAIVPLLRDGANVDFRNERHEHLLHIAVERQTQHGNIDTIDALLDAGANVSVRDRDGNTPLHVAAEKSCAEVMETLLDYGCMVDAVNNRSETPLHVAARHDNVEAVTVLLAWGASATCVSGSSLSPLTVAANLSHKDAAIAMFKIEYLRTNTWPEEAKTVFKIYPESAQWLTKSNLPESAIQNAISISLSSSSSNHSVSSSTVNNNNTGSTTTTTTTTNINSNLSPLSPLPLTTAAGAASSSSSSSAGAQPPSPTARPLSGFGNKRLSVVDSTTGAKSGKRMSTISSSENAALAAAAEAAENALLSVKGQSRSSSREHSPSTTRRSVSPNLNDERLGAMSLANAVAERAASRLSSKGKKSSKDHIKELKASKKGKKKYKVVVVKKNSDNLGFCLCGGIEDGQLPSVVLTGSPKYSSDSVFYDHEEIVSINGQSVIGETLAGVNDLIKRSKTALRFEVLPAVEDAEPEEHLFEYPQEVKQVMLKKIYDMTVPLTTRPPKPTEIPGIEYNFISKEVFEAFIEQERFLEWGFLNNNYYGTLKNSICASGHQGLQQDDVVNRIRLRRENGAFGFGLLGGIETNELPIVGKIFHINVETSVYGPLKVGDALLAVNGVNVAGDTLKSTKLLLDQAGDVIDLVVLCARPGQRERRVLTSFLSFDISDSPEMQALKKDVATTIYKNTVPYTTRAPREGEVDGEHYNFITEDRFKELVRGNEFLEWGSQNGVMYGTLRPKEPVLLNKRASLVAKVSNIMSPLGSPYKGLDGFDDIVPAANDTTTMKKSKDRMSLYTALDEPSPVGISVDDVKISTISARPSTSSAGSVSATAALATNAPADTRMSTASVMTNVTTVDEGRRASLLPPIAESRRSSAGSVASESRKNSSVSEDGGLTSAAAAAAAAAAAMVGEAITAADAVVEGDDISRKMSGVSSVDPSRKPSAVSVSSDTASAVAAAAGGAAAGAAGAAAPTARDPSMSDIRIEVDGASGPAVTESESSGSTKDRLLKLGMMESSSMSSLDITDSETGSRRMAQRAYSNGDLTSSLALSDVAKLDNAAMINLPATLIDTDSKLQFVARTLELFAALVDDMNDESSEGFKREYQALAPVGTSHTKDASRNNKSKNRYTNVLAYDHSRVVLSAENSPQNDYINANWINGFDGSTRAYIATQGPSPTTFNDFWMMMWQESVPAIVMVTNEVEGGKVKCDRYWPDVVGQPKTYGPIEVALLETVTGPIFVTRHFNIKHTTTGEERMIAQFAYLVWPDHGAPRTAADILEFRASVRQYVQDIAGRTEPIAVHCSAGVGRSGSFIAVDRLLNQFVAYIESGEFFDLEMSWIPDVVEVVKDMRNSRNLMVQTVEQYIFVYCAISLFLKTLKDTAEIVLSQQQSRRESEEDNLEDDTEA